jgi:hypothetical protein
LVASYSGRDSLCRDFETGRIIALFHIAFNQRLIKGVYVPSQYYTKLKKQNETNNKFYIDGRPVAFRMNEQTAVNNYYQKVLDGLYQQQ